MKSVFYKSVFSLFLMLNSSSYTQTAIIGAKVEPFYLFSKIGSENESRFYTTSFHCFGFVKINSALQLGAQIGLLLSEGRRYNGFETCFSGKYFFRQDEEYILSGFVVHKNVGDNGAFFRTIDNNILLGMIGGGKYISETIFIEASYQFPIGNNEISETIIWDTLDPYKKQYIKNKLIGLLKIGIGISFDL